MLKLLGKSLKKSGIFAGFINIKGEKNSKFTMEKLRRQYPNQDVSVNTTK